MSTLAVYLSRLLLIRFILILFGLTAFLISLDLMVNTNSLLARGEGVDSLFRYAVLRTPTALSEMIKIAYLLSGLLTFASLIRQNELTIIWGTGISQFGLLGRLVPLSLLLGALQFAVDDRAVPAGVKALQEGGFGGYSNLQDADTTKGVTWFHIGSHIVRVADENIGDASLKDITIFERDAEGTLLARVDVASANYVGESWVLNDILRKPVGLGQVEREVRREWEIDLDPKSLKLLNAHPRNLSFDQISRFVDGNGQGTWAPNLYRTWLYERLMAALAPLLMLLLAIALAQQSQRNGSLGQLFFAGVSVGFAFFIIEGVSLAMGEAGLLPPLLASAVPIMAFAAGASGVIFWHELKRRPAQAPLP